jgi:hypothetical protein
MFSTPAPARGHAALRAARLLVVALAAPLPFAASAHEPTAAHAHGQATLDVAVEPRRLSLQLSSPLDNLLGFERAPRTDKERRLADAAVARLRAAEELFKIDPAAQCRLVDVTLSSAALKLGTADASGETSAHADIDGTFAFECADAARAAYIDVGLFAFKRLHRLDVQVAAPAGQFKRTLTAKQSRLSLGR